ncbi:class I SAM-dependent methyltransferase [Spirosoma foliorum]|uniref:Class I SAM-dependent methyltransferase n=1 Tax=Spirosoma foliorum TaxID=2710596 RepID=A0A7G5GQ40_9BACT|nr:class I SAM-dependent methyltransferase [Spirosoma foliorum]QMW00982.1 class I SAM-dependent methyltransferase [Spirosoma foliorum]
MGSQKMQAQLWSIAAQDWADYQETTLLPVFEQIAHDFSQIPARALLDVGCGSGLFCQLALQQGLNVSGLDATAELITIAQRKAPNGHFTTGDMEEMPYPDHSFDLVTGINSFQYAASPVQALKEAYRVLKPTGKLVVAIWGKAQECQAAVYLKALGALMPPPPPGTPGPFALSEDGALEKLVGDAGFQPGMRQRVSCPFVYPDLHTALKGLLSAGPAQRAIGNTSYEAAAEAVTNAIAPFRTELGGYRMGNTFYILEATK